MNDESLLPNKENTSSYELKEFKECDDVASDTRTISKSQSKSDSLPPEPHSTLNKERVWTVAACALIACLASLVNVGMMLGFSSPALKQLQFNVSEEFQLSDTDVKYSLFGVGVYDLAMLLFLYRTYCKLVARKK